MNLRAKKENINPNKVLSDKTNVSNQTVVNNKPNEPLKLNTTARKSKVTKPKKTRQTRTRKIHTKPNETNDTLLNGSEEKENGTKKVPYCFGFSDDDLENDVPPFNGELTEFDPSKPYRLALYVKPSKTIRLNSAIVQKIQSLNPTLNLTNMTLNNTTASAAPAKKRLASESIMSPNRTQWKVPFSSTPKDNKKNQSKLVQKKITDLIPMSSKRTRSAATGQHFTSYFEDSSSSTESEGSTPPSKAKKLQTDVPVKMGKKAVEQASLRQDESSSDDAPEPTRFQKPSRRSYVKKTRLAPEVEDEPPTEEIIKSIEKIKRKGRGKKAEKEDEDFEKWSRSMNSMFSEVDQFEISFD